MNLTGAEILSNSSYNLYTAGVRIHVVRVAIKFLSIDIKNDWFKSYIRVYLILLLETPCSSVRHVFYPHLTRTHTNLMCERARATFLKVIDQFAPKSTKAHKVAKPNRGLDQWEHT